jgi:hypothetical protein
MLMIEFVTASGPLRVFRSQVRLTNRRHTRDPELPVKTTSWTNPLQMRHVWAANTHQNSVKSEVKVSDKCTFEVNFNGLPSPVSRFKSRIRHHRRSLRRFASRTGLTRHEAHVRMRTEAPGPNWP